MSMTESDNPDFELQRQFWNEWNISAREHQQQIDEPSLARAAFVVSSVRRFVPQQAKLVDLGCGTGWLSEQLAAHVENVTAVDLADEVIERARSRAPHIRFMVGDVMTVPDDSGYDTAVCVETFSHVPDQAAFVDRLADLLRPGGILILTTQNRTVFGRSRVMQKGKGQIRRWVTPKELRYLLGRRFSSLEVRTIVPAGDQGWLRLISGRRFCRVWEGLFGKSRWKSVREWAGLGQTITVVATKR
jgi:2-polyprenyl-3-methyl-5-hydroxy-6-metoxy-1,4-benzoquinol methylase